MFKYVDSSLAISYCTFSSAFLLLCIPKLKIFNSSCSRFTKLKLQVLFFGNNNYESFKLSDKHVLNAIV